MKKFLGLLLFTAVSLVSCEKLYNTSKGKQISFTVSGAATYWTADDDIRISCPESSISRSSSKWADYQAPLYGSTSPIVPSIKDTALRWGNGLHHFYAVYPASEITGNVVAATIPSVQDTDSPRLSLYGYMTAAAEAIRSEQAVNLPFKPMYTTLEFAVSPGDDVDVVVSGFRLVSAGGARAGGFKAALSAQEEAAITIGSDSSSEITVNLGQTGSVTVNRGETFVVSVIALPKDLTDLTAYFIVDGVEKALPLVDKNGNPLVIAACKKSIIKSNGFLAPDQEGFFQISIESQDVDEYDITY